MVISSTVLEVSDTAEESVSFFYDAASTEKSA